MSEAVTVPNLMMMNLTVSEESLARDRQTDTHTDRQTWSQSSSLKFALQTKKKKVMHVLNPDLFTP